MSSSNSFPEQSSKTITLSVKLNQNMVIDLDPSKYPAIIQPLIVCLNYSRLKTAFTITAQVPLVHLSTAYSSTIYDKAEESISFEVAGFKTAITLSRFRKIFNLPCSPSTIHPDDISPMEIQKTFYRMGYSGDITKLSNFKKSHLPPVWNALFTILFKSFSERVAGSDSSNKLFYSLMHGLFNGEDVDFGQVLWTQLIQSIASTSRHSEISCARFWAVIVDKALKHANTPIMKDSLLAQIPVYQPSVLQLTDRQNFEFMASLPDEMIDNVPLGNSIIAEYIKTTVSGERLIPKELIVAMEINTKSKRGGKRKAIESEASPKQKKKKSKKKKSTMSSSQQQEEEIVHEQQQEEQPHQIEEEEEAHRNDDESHNEDDESNQTPPHQSSPKRSPSPQQQSPEHQHEQQDEQQQHSPEHTQSPHHSDDYLYGDDDDDLTGFVASSAKFSLEDDEGSIPHVSSAQFDSLNQKLDSLLASSSSQNSQWESVLAANTKVLKDSAKVVADSELALAEATAKVDKLNTDVREFMTTFQTVFESNTAGVNKIIASFGESLKNEKKALADLREEMKTEHSEMITEVTSKIEKLKADLAMENTVMDALAEKSSRLSNKALLTRVLQEKLLALTSEKAIFTTSLSEVISYLSKILETNDSILTPSVRHHLSDKLTPAILLLKQLVSVSEIGYVPKQGGEDDKKDVDDDDNNGGDSENKEKEPGRGNKSSAEENPKAASSSGASGSKRKKKIIGEDDLDSDDLSETEEEKEKKIKEMAEKDKELDELNALRRNLDAKEAREMEAKLDLETRKSLFPEWDVRRMLLEAIETPKELWLEPAVSFDLSNSVDCQLDFPTTPRAFLFRCFDQTLHKPLSDTAINRKLFDFYAKHALPPYETWSLKKIVALKVHAPIKQDIFVNVGFTGMRGSDKVPSEFSLADLPTMNPLDWIVIFRILSKEPENKGPLIIHFRRMLKSYIIEVSKLDIEIANLLHSKPLAKAEKEPSSISRIKLGVINKKNWSVVYKKQVGDKASKSMFFLKDKHLYPNETLETLISLTNACKDNSEADKNCFTDMLKWYLVFRKTLIRTMSQVFVASGQRPVTKPEDPT